MFKFVKQNFNQNQLLFVSIFFNSKAKTSSSTKKNKMDNTIFRDWVTNPEYVNYQRKRGETPITVMSWNILAQDLIDQHPYLYSRHNKEDLNYDQRSKILFREMRHIKPDILCLQEMQENHLNDFKVTCNTIDLQEVIFKKRTGQDQTDGCAIFFNSNLMELIKEEKVEYQQPNIDVLNRTNVAIIAKFRLKKSPNSVLVVATTHLLYNPRRQDVRLAQLQVLLAEIERIAYRGVNEFKQSQYESIILTGDFNFQPNTAHYALLLNGFLKYNNLTKRLECNNAVYEPKFGKRLLPIELGITDNCQHYQSIKFNDRSTTTLHNSELQKNVIAPTADELKNSYLPFETGTLSHQLNLSSVYNSRTSVSTFQNQWVLVDYIFYRREFNQMTNQFEEKNLKLLARFELPSFQHCFNYLHNGGIPNKWQGSDHFSLAAKFMLSPTSPIQSI